MCFHDRPTRNDEERGYLNPDGSPWRAPGVQDGDEILFDECGRCAPQVNGTGSIDYHSHHFRIVRDKKTSGATYLLVKHGGGQERIKLGYSHTRIPEILALLDSDSRYLMIHALYSVHRDAATKAEETERSRWQRAAAEKRIRTRKARGGDTVKVWIE